VARELGLRQHLMEFDEALGSRSLLEQAFELNRKLAAPILSICLPAYLPLARRARAEGVRTILTGQGGDEWLGAAPLLTADLIRRGAFVELAQFFGALQRSFHLSLLQMARLTFWTSGLRPLVAMALHRLMPEAHEASRRKRLLAGDPSWVAPDPKLREAQRHRAAGALPHPDPAHGFYMREQRDGLDHPLVSLEAEEQYEWSKGVGIRLLQPFLDADLAELLYRTPPRLLSEGGWSKALVRGSVARRFPDLGLESQRKVHIPLFYGSIYLRELPTLVDEVGNFPLLSALGIVDGRLVGRFVRDTLKRGGTRVERIFHILNLESWVRLHLC
jgi:asparagine synthetase B (glutamine-hydrolysing)